MNHPLNELVNDQKKGIKRGITSVCSANAFVIQAAMENAEEYDEYVLIEATANQVNQFGGYTGMRPQDFVEFVNRIADDCGFDRNKLILGGDHLGPLTWTSENEQKAMENAEELIRQYVLAGFTKIHIDTSMKLADDDKHERLSDLTIARRGALLCDAAEQAFTQLIKNDPNALAPVYIIGSEVPIPGGAQEEEGLQVTAVKDFVATVQTFKDEFDGRGLHDAWERVVAVVVQPGVEFGDIAIHEYDREKAVALVGALEQYPNLIFEGHSTDYQTPVNLRHMVEDGIAILKVGPALTFALREALFALEMIEKELLSGAGVYLSGLKDILERQMLMQPGYWEKHYHGSMDELILKRRYSLSDRSRYYLPNPKVEHAIERLINNLNSTEIPIVLLSQYMPIQYTKVRAGILNNDPLSLIKDRIVNCLDEYGYGCGR